MSARLRIIIITHLIYFFNYYDPDKGQSLNSLESQGGYRIFSRPLSNAEKLLFSQTGTTPQQHCLRCLPCLSIFLRHALASSTTQRFCYAPLESIYSADRCEASVFGGDAVSASLLASTASSPKYTPSACLQ